MSWKVNPEYKELDKPWVEHHDNKTTQATIKEILKDGTPRWITHPDEFKNYAIEAMHEEKEISNDMVLGYRMSDQEQLIDFKARNVNIISTIDFVRKLKDNGIRCFACYAGMPQTVGLWAIVSTKSGVNVRYITYLQIPAMIEYDVLRLDAHGLPNGVEYRGWRSVVCELIKKQVITERRAVEIFGAPTDSIVSRRYRRIPPRIQTPQIRCSSSRWSVVHKAVKSIIRLQGEVMIIERQDPNKGASQDGDPKQSKTVNVDVQTELKKLDAQEAKQAPKAPAATPTIPQAAAPAATAVDPAVLQSLVQALLASSAIAMKREERLAAAEELEEARKRNKVAQYEKNRANETKIDLVKQSVCKHLKGGKHRRKSSTKDYAVYMHTFISGETYIKCQLCGMKWRPTDTVERVVRNGMVYKNHTGKGWREALMLMEDSTNTASRSEIPQSQWHLVESTVNLETPLLPEIDTNPIGQVEV